MKADMPYLVTASTFEELPGYYEWLDEIEKERQAEEKILAEEPNMKDFING
jgi:hypothetical protein